jgi:hypothetical protein
VKLRKIYLQKLDVMVNDPAQVADSLRRVKSNRLLGTVSSALRALGREYVCHDHFPFKSMRTTWRRIPCGRY